MRSAAAVRHQDFEALASEISLQLSDPSERVELSLTRPAVSRPRQLAAINQIGRAAEQIRKLQELGALAERRAGEAEENIQPLKRLLAEKEDRLVAALDAVLHERKRYQDLERRSADMLDRAQAMIAEADQRIQASEKRASVAEEHLEALQAAVTRAFID